MNQQSVTVLDCGHGNLASVANAIRALGATPKVTGDPDQIRSAASLIFPGQGSAPQAMRSLSATGLGAAFVEAVGAGTPALGICLGMQLALQTSDEGPTTCLGLIPGESLRFIPSPAAAKVPQIGWNAVHHGADPLFDGIPSGAHFYFVHSYYCEPAPATAIGWTEYGNRYCSALRHDHFWATQFHPEKSGPFGLRLLSNFLILSRC